MRQPDARGSRDSTEYAYETDGTDRDKGRAKGRAILLSEAMIVNTSQGDAARRAGAVLWKSRRKSRSWSPGSYYFRFKRSPILGTPREESFEDHVFITPRAQGGICFSHDFSM